MGLALVAKSTETEPALCLPGQTVADCEETACRVVINSMLFVAMRMC